MPYTVMLSVNMRLGKATQDEIVFIKISLSARRQSPKPKKYKPITKRMASPLSKLICLGYNTVNHSLSYRKISITIIVVITFEEDSSSRDVGPKARAG